MMVMVETLSGEDFCYCRAFDGRFLAAPGCRGFADLMVPHLPYRRRCTGATGRCNFVTTQAPGPQFPIRRPAPAREAGAREPDPGGHMTGQPHARRRLAG